jgi:galactokinase
MWRTLRVGTLADAWPSSAAATGSRHECRDGTQECVRHKYSRWTIRAPRVYRDRVRADAREYFREIFGNSAADLVAAPGRVNLIGEHVDYHGLPVLPMALRRSIAVAFRPREDRRIRAASKGFGAREFEWAPALAPAADGDWENYLRAAAEAVSRKWGVGKGIDAAVVSDLPPAAGLSSSSALLVAFALALLRANGIRAAFEELMEVLPDGEQFVGTRGGGMDHAASLASQAGCASLIGFEPLTVRAIPIPGDWGFLVAHSLRTAEKSGSVREAYNARRAAGAAALKWLGYPRYSAVVEHLAALGVSPADWPAGETRNGLSPAGWDAFIHVAGEALRVRQAVEAIERRDAALFGRLLLQSHASLRDRLRVSCPELDGLVDAAMASGAAGARLTGAGFGGCAVVFAAARDLPAVREGMIARFYSARPEFDAARHLIDAQPGPGALHMENS